MDARMGGGMGGDPMGGGDPYGMMQSQGGMAGVMSGGYPGFDAAMGVMMGGGRRRRRCRRC